MFWQEILTNNYIHTKKTGTIGSAVHNFKVYFIVINTSYAVSGIFSCSPFFKALPKGEGIEGYIEKRKIDRQIKMVEKCKNRKWRECGSEDKDGAIRDDAAPVQKIISLLNDGNIDSDDDSHN